MSGHYTLVLGFAKQVIAGAQKKPVMLAPLVMNIALAVPVNAVLILATLFVSDALANLLMPVGLSALYFIDYFAGGLNTAMVYEEQTTGKAALGSAFKRTLKSIVGITIFAVVSGLLDFAVQILSDRRLHMLRPLLQIVRSFWSTATFVIMPSMIIEGLGFGAAFARSKELASKDPTQLGVGYVSIGLATSLISMAGFFVVSFVGYRILWPISPLMGLAFELVVVNATWAIAAYLKSTYYTCYYMWTRECERHQGVNPAFAPAPLRNVLAGVDFASMGIQLVPATGAGVAAQAVAGAGPSPFGMPPQQGGFGAPQGYAPASAYGAPPQAFAQGPQGFGAQAQPGFAPQPGFGPQPGFAPQPQAFAPQAFAPQPQQAFAPSPQPQAYPQPYVAPAPAPQHYPQPQPQFSAPAPQPYPQPQPQHYPQPQPQFSAPAPQHYPQPQHQPQSQPQFVAPVPQARPQLSAPPVQPSPYAPGPSVQPRVQPPPPLQPTPPPAVQAHPEHEAFDAGDLDGPSTMISPSPFDDEEEATRIQTPR